MKRWTILLLTAALLLQTACSDSPRVPVQELTDRTEVQMEEVSDPLKSYPAERPMVSEPEKPKEEPPKEETPQNNETPVEQPAEIPAEPPKTEVPVQKPAEQAPVTQPPAETPPVQTSPQETVAPVVRNDETRAVWFSFFELETMLMNQGESAFTKNIGAAFDNVKAMGLNTVIMQVRPYADAVYPSDYFPWSYLAAGTEGKNPGFDPLDIMVREAHNRGLSIEAWLNPYRVRNSNYNDPLSADNVVAEYLKNGDAIEYGGGIYFNPASEKSRQLIVNGVKEIAENYNVDGIHFDDYFYPTTDEAFDKASYSAYKNNGGRLSLAEWRMENVNLLVKAVYQTVHSVSSDLRFGISPQGNLANNYDKQFIDVEKWLSSEGYVDYICPQVYFGFDNGTSPYAETVEQWNRLIKNSNVELLIGLAPYKVGTEDTWAGEGKNEWKQNSDLLSRMVLQAREESNYNGFVLFRYDSLFHPSSAVKGQMNKEIDKLKEVLK